MHMSGEGKRERGTERILSRLQVRHGAIREAGSQHRESMTCAQIESRTLNQLSLPGGHSHSLVRTVLL